MLILFLLPCMAEITACVEPELTVVSDRQVQLQIDEWLTAKGVTIDCVRYTYAIGFYSVEGMDYTGVTNYTVLHVEAPNVIAATVVQDSPRYNYGLWVVTLRYKDQVQTITRTRATSLRSAVNGVVKTMRK